MDHTTHPDLYIFDCSNADFGQYVLDGKALVEYYENLVRQPPTVEQAEQVLRDEKRAYEQYCVAWRGLDSCLCAGCRQDYREQIHEQCPECGSVDFAFYSSFRESI